FQAEDGIRDGHVTGVQTCALPISVQRWSVRRFPHDKPISRGKGAAPFPCHPQSPQNQDSASLPVTRSRSQGKRSVSYQTLTSQELFSQELFLTIPIASATIASPA